MNVTARHGQGAVHIAGREHAGTPGTYASACGIGATGNSYYTTSGFKNVQPLRPTDKSVTCKRCEKIAAKDAEKAQAEVASASQAKPEPTPTRKTRTFTFEYNASEGVLIAATLREKALDERKAAQAYRTNAEIDGTTLVEFYTKQARLADNRAKLYEEAADRMQQPVREAVLAAVEKAIPSEPEPTFHRQVKDAIGLRW